MIEIALKCYVKCEGEFITAIFDPRAVCKYCGSRVPYKRRSE